MLRKNVELLFTSNIPLVDNIGCIIMKEFLWLMEVNFALHI